MFPSCYGRGFCTSGRVLGKSRSGFCTGAMFSLVVGVTCVLVGAACVLVGVV